MTVNNPTILALDFDGVICDGLIEYFEVSWRTYCQVWVDNKMPPSDLPSKFYRLRPVIETGWEMPVLIKALLIEIPETKILQEWGKIAQQILQEDKLKASEIGIKLDQVRDEWIAKDLDRWLSLHKFYRGVTDKLKKTLASKIKVYIVTTKEGRFTQQLLQEQGVEIPREAIIGKEVKRPKYEILAQLIDKENNQLANLWFVEDRLKTLQLVAQQPKLEEVKLFLADWGYNTPLEKTTAQNDPRIQLLSLSQFAEDFSEWLH